MATNQTKSRFSVLPNTTVEAAASGDVDAINTVLKHFERYLTALSTRTLYDENGNPHLCVDEDMKRRLETKLITKIINFDIRKIA
jgi:hypothetical protein